MYLYQHMLPLPGLFIICPLAYVFSITFYLEFFTFQIFTYFEKSKLSSASDGISASIFSFSFSTKVNFWIISSLFSKFKWIYEAALGWCGNSRIEFGILGCRQQQQTRLWCETFSLSQRLTASHDHRNLNLKHELYQGGNCIEFSNQGYLLSMGIMKYFRQKLIFAVVVMFYFHYSC